MFVFAKNERSERAVSHLKTIRHSEILKYVDSATDAQGRLWLITERAVCLVGLCGCCCLALLVWSFSLFKQSESGFPNFRPNLLVVCVHSVLKGWWFLCLCGLVLSVLFSV